MKWCAPSYLLFLLVVFPFCTPEEEPLFAPVPSSHSGIEFSNEVEESEAINIIEYLYFYNGGGIASGDINNDGLIDLYFTANQGLDRLYLNQGGLAFKDITEMAGVGGAISPNKWTTGATMVDLNADGWLDIYVCEVNGYKELTGRNRLYINDGASAGGKTFTEQAAAYGLDLATYAQQAAFFDYDLDGDLDVFLLNHAVHTPDSYKRAEGRKIRDELAGDRLMRNDDGFFTDVTEASGVYSGAMGYGLAVSVGDLNDDGFPDIYVSNDFHENDYLYLNRGDGTFLENITGSTGHVSTFSMGNDIADFNNDGRLDILTVDMQPEDERIRKRSSGVDPYDIYQYKLSFGYHYQYARNMLQLNQGAAPGGGPVRFSEIGQLAGISATDWSWSALFADLDNDGRKDIFITNGIPARPNDLDYIKFVSNELVADSLSDRQIVEKMPPGRAANYAFQNAGWRFHDRSMDWGLALEGYSNGAVYADLDNDGDLDLVVNNLNERAAVYRNHAREKYATNYLAVKLVGDRFNPNAVGARVDVFSGPTRQTLENQLARGWLSGSCQPALHFGLGDRAHVDSVKVYWPGGKEQVVYDVPVNATVEVYFQHARPARPNGGSPRKTLLEEVTDRSGITFSQQEVFHNDFAAEKLIPRVLSAEGPKIAVADVNGDGWEDFYVGGAEGQAGELYLQQPAGPPYFQKDDVPVFQDHRAFEDAGAAFFDADQDGDQDLYVASGGGERGAGESLRDRLYLNDGKGNFAYAPDLSPGMEINGSCVVPFDADQDGRIDLFIGARSVPRQYGLPGPSKFLLNKGGGRFVDATDQLPEKDGRIGMVTDAVWVEERKELVIVGEWMPVTIYRFFGGHIEQKKLDHTAGWWNTVEAADLDGDGDTDLLLGNAGLNLDLSASPAEPLDLYVRDFDDNRSSDPLMAYYRNGVQWPYPHLDLLAEQIVGVKKKYRTYEAYAGSTFSEVFPAAELAKSYHIQVQTLQSAVLEYDGAYRLFPLPDEAQFSPIYGFAAADLDGDRAAEAVAVGNFYGNQPAMGRSDASFGIFFDVSGPDAFQARPAGETGFAVPGEARDIKILPAPDGGKWILVARNGDRLLLFKYPSGGSFVTAQ